MKEKKNAIWHQLILRLSFAIILKWGWIHLHLKFRRQGSFRFFGRTVSLAQTAVKMHLWMLNTRTVILALGDFKDQGWYIKNLLRRFKLRSSRKRYSVEFTTKTNNAFCDWHLVFKTVESQLLHPIVISGQSKTYAKSWRKMPNSLNSIISKPPKTLLDIQPGKSTSWEHIENI